MNTSPNSLCAIFFKKAQHAIETLRHIKIEGDGWIEPYRIVNGLKEMNDLDKRRQHNKDITKNLKCDKNILGYFVEDTSEEYIIIPVKISALADDSNVKKRPKHSLSSHRKKNNFKSY